MPPVTIYSNPNCQPCNMTKRQFDKQGIPYDVIDMSQDEEARKYAMSLGYLEAPVVVVGERSWSGYRPANIQELKVG